LNEGVIYSIEEHQHRHVAWSSATSARASKLCRFSVEVGVAILESSGFVPAFSTPEQLPLPEELDAKHADWRHVVIQAAETHGLVFSHGIAAKLINCYLKGRFVNAGHHEHPQVAVLHPPIDRLLLKALADENVGGCRRAWRRLEKRGWSKFTSEDYQEVIDLIRQVMPGQPLWKIEQYWRGFQ